MAKSAVTPARRRRRILRDALLLAVVLVVLLLRTEFPIFTAGQALAATQARYFFGPGEVAAVLDYTTSRLISRLAVRSPVGNYDRYYILRQGDWYAWCGINRFGPFWRSGGLGAVENDPDTPLVPLVIYGDGYDYCGLVLALCNDPDIARVEAECPVLTDSGFLLITTDQFQRVDNHFLVSWETDRNWLFAEALRLRGYDQAGNLIYESPVPESWAEEYNISDPDGWRYRYEAIYPGEAEP